MSESATNSRRERPRPACVIAGAGPAGMMCGYLLARAGIEVTVLEKHKDFLRDFRGDTVHPSTLQVMEELGLLDDFLVKRPREEPLLPGLGRQAVSRAQVDADHPDLFHCQRTFLFHSRLSKKGQRLRLRTRVDTATEIGEQTQIECEGGLAFADLAQGGLHRNVDVVDLGRIDDLR